jgi:hypothetical protein
MIDTRKIVVGARVVLRPGFGMDAPVVATVSGFGIKNGRHLIDYDDGTRWAYLDQVDVILPAETEHQPKKVVL